ncbi:MAG: cytochrome c oxidase accessory protein CcoG [Bacteroidetes bacterium]|nr:cytochrome c oxidase accessory protein CcoG [Bacteroidota bacterium]
MTHDEQRFDQFRDKISTVDEKGKRIWVFPKKQVGKYFNRRQIFAYSLLALLLAGPFIKISGEPLLMINIIERKFVIFGQIFWPEDIFLFAFGMIAFVILVIVFTVVFGRLFCGWACPQTIFMEFIFRRIEYWVDGDWNQQKQLDKMPWNGHKIFKRTLKWSLFWLVSFVIANIFLAYIIGSDGLKDIIIDDPKNHIGGLTAIVVFTTIFFAVFAWFREQVCIAVCPYGRLQGVLLDKHSVLVAYDHVRGEKRAKFKKGEDRKAAGKGDCIDCHQCVNVCPTGIDIRNGTQLECINCTLCMDACDQMMDGVGLKKGLIRYDSESSIRTGESWKITRRAKAYIALMIAIVGLLTTLLLTRSEIDTTILRIRGTSYQHIDEDTYSNIYEVTITNKTNQVHDVTFKVLSGNAEVELIGGHLQLKEGEQVKRNLLVKMDDKNVTGPKTDVLIGIYSGDRLVDKEEISFSGPGF